MNAINSAKDWKSILTVVVRLHAVLLCLLTVVITARSQAPFFQPSTAAYTPLTEQPGAPAGSYPLSGFDNVNLFNGNLSFSLPLMQIGGRGRAGYTMMLPIEQRWQVQTVAVPTCDWSGCTYPEGNYRYIANPVWWTGIRPGFSPGVVQGRQSGSDPFYLAGCSNTVYNKTLTRLTFIAPEGTEYELRDQQTGGEPLQGVGCFGGPSRGKVFVTADGSAITFISDAAISDDRQPHPQIVLSPSGFLLFRDGTRYRIDNGKTTWIQDTNGNRISFTYSGNNLVGIDDSLNRHITISGGVISFKGSNGATRTITVHSAPLSTVLRKHPDGSTEYTIKTFAQLFPSLQNPQQGTFDIPVTTAVELPDGRQYQFRYDSYANLAQVILPTGGRIEYDWTTDVYPFADHVYGIFKRVLERRTALNTTTTTYETRTTYTNPINPPTNVTVDNLDPKNGNALISRSKHYFHGHWLTNPSAANLYPAWLEGREYQTELFAANGTTVLHRVNKTFQQRAAIPWWTGSAQGSPPNDTRLVETTTTLVDTNQVSKVTSIDPNNPTGPVGFDQYNNKTKVWEYDFGSGAPGALIRQTVTSYLTNGYDTLLPNASNPDVSQTFHIRNLATQISFYDAGGTERSRSIAEYDNYVADSFHAALVNRSNISGHDSAVSTSYIKRGNITAVSNYLLPAGTAITTYGQFDIAGNLVKTIDPRSTAGNIIATTIGYDDNFGAPDHSLAERFTFTELGSQQTFAFRTTITNALNQPAFSQYDYHLGQPINQQDLNGTIVAGYHNDSLDRLTQVRRAFGTSAENQTTFEYDDDDRFILTKSDLDSYNDNVILTKQIYDGLGRTIEVQQFEGGTNYIAVQTQYDGAGREFKTSNPFRQSQTAVWTTTAFDSLERITSVSTPDGATISKVYSGNAVTVTDQAGKVSRSINDALGRLTRADEPDASGNLGAIGSPVQSTTYSYDVLDNLTSVTQGSQQRFFMYDSFKRLIRARGPEQSTLAALNLSDPITGNSAWSVGYQYDASGNLTQKTDPRGVISIYAYDVLNRNTTIDYSDTASINPDVKRFYDGATNGKGHFWYHYTNGDFSTGNNVEHTSTDSYDALGRPLVQRQLFKLNGTWSATYQISRTYNRAGSVKTQTYPSGHAVTYNYDTAGRLADKDASNLAFTGNLGDGVQRTYSSGIGYSQWGTLGIERFGTQTAVYHKLQYNIRGQLWDVRVSTGSDPNGSWNRGALQFFYDSTYGFGTSGPDNNGNVLKSKHYVPLDDSSSAWAIHDQVYSYDSLNRLLSMSEYFVTSSQSQTQQSLQSYVYDRWGNRTINPSSWGIGINTKQFTVDTATNRLGVPVGQSGTMTYDGAGNLTTDSYSGSGARTYDAENRMTTAIDFTGQTSQYTYNAAGRRTRRKAAGSQERWDIYGFDGELLAEYRASSPASSPEKEYGYRNGKLLVSASGRFNVALAANGAVATASSAHSCCGFSTTGAINGNNRGPWGNGEGWNDATENVVPDWIQVEFAGSKAIDEISVFSLHDNYTQENTPTETQTFSLYGLLAFDVQYWNGSSWVTIPGGSVTGNNKVWRKFTFSAITTNKIRVHINSVPDAWSRVVEIQAFGTSAGGEKVQWLVADQLGTPRIIVDETGSRTNVKRHDYLPFGEELFAGAGGRSPGLGYTGSVSDGIRQQFTSKERDTETGLDYFLARYYSSTQGRFTSPDEFSGGPAELLVKTRDSKKQALPYADISQPQSLNKYTYAYNSPCRYIDPDGHCAQPKDLKPGDVGICVASFIATTFVPPGVPPGRGDNRGPNGNGGTSRMEVRVTVNVKEGSVTKTDESVSRSGAFHKNLGPQGGGESRVGGTTKDEKGNVYFQINQSGSSSVLGVLGTIDNHLNMVVTPDGKVGVTDSSKAKDYPSLEIYKYTVDAKGNVTTTLILHKKESGNMLDLRGQEKPIKADPK